MTVKASGNLALMRHNKFSKWMIDHSTYPELVKWTPEYLARQGMSKFVDQDDMSIGMKSRESAGQNRVKAPHRGKDRCTAPGATRSLPPSLFHHVDNQFLDEGFIGKLLKLTHFQWIFHNITKHHTNGMVKLEAKHDVMKETKR